jgi:DNA replication protein DnaC
MRQAGSTAHPVEHDEGGDVKRIDEVRIKIPPPSHDAEQRYQAYLEEQRRIEVRELWANCAASGSGLPRWRYADFGNADWVRRVNRRILVAAKTWINGNLLLMGPTGYGKTSATVAMMRQLFRDATFNAPPWFMFAALQDLVDERRGHPLGRGEAPGVAAAFRVQLLILDEVWSEGGAQSVELLRSIVDQRYRRQLATVVTSGLTEAQFTNHFGLACWRRLTEGAVVVDVHEVAK